MKLALKTLNGLFIYMCVCIYTLKARLGMVAHISNPSIQKRESGNL